MTTEKAKHDSKKVSLNPLQFEEALSDLLKVKPEPKEEKPRKKPQARKKKPASKDGR